MVEIINSKRLDELSESIVLDYLKSRMQDPSEIICVDIEGLAREYFKLDIIYETIAEDDPGKVAYCSNGISPLKIRRGDLVYSATFPKNTIVIDSYYKSQKASTAKRFIIGHEVGHKILSRVAESHRAGRYHTIFDEKRTYSHDELKSQFSLPERQADQISASLQLPSFLLGRTVSKIFGKEGICLYGANQLMPGDSEKLNRAACTLGVSPLMLLIEMRKRKMVRYRTLDEYLRLTGLHGGTR